MARPRKYDDVMYVGINIRLTLEQHDTIMSMGDTKYWRDIILAMVEAKKIHGIFIANFGEPTNDRTDTQPGN